MLSNQRLHSVRGSQSTHDLTLRGIRVSYNGAMMPISTDMCMYMRNRREDKKCRARQLLGNACVQCGSTIDLQFDHINPTTKHNTIANMFSHGEKLFLEEIAKCQLLCRTCHIEKTRIDFGWSDPDNRHGTHTSYTHDKCRCRECCQAHTNYMRRYRRSVAKDIIPV